MACAASIPVAPRHAASSRVTVRPFGAEHNRIESSSLRAQQQALCLAPPSSFGSPVKSDDSMDAVAKIKDWQMRRAMLGRPMKMPFSMMLGAASSLAQSCEFAHLPSLEDPKTSSVAAENRRLNQLLVAQSRSMEKLTAELNLVHSREDVLLEENASLRQQVMKLQKELQEPYQENASLRAQLKKLQEELQEALQQHACRMPSMSEAFCEAAPLRKQRADAIAAVKAAENIAMRRQRGEAQHVQRLSSTRKPTSCPTGHVQVAEDVGADLAQTAASGADVGPHMQLSAEDAEAREATSSQTSAGKLHGQPKDEIDERLAEFLETTKCPLHFKRVNRGWYQFWPASQVGKAARKRHVEMSVVNGKLVVRSEAGMHDEPWNGGKPGAIERFTMSVTADV